MPVHVLGLSLHFGGHQILQVMIYKIGTDDPFLQRLIHVQSRLNFPVVLGNEIHCTCVHSTDKFACAFFGGTEYLFSGRDTGIALYINYVFSASDN